MDFNDIRTITTGRIGRGVYALYTVAYLLIYALIRTFDPTFPAPYVLPLVWILWIAARRFHDFGQRGWWAFLPFAAGFAVGFINAFVGRASDLPKGSTASISQALLAVVTLFSLGFMVWLGVKKGHQGPNRFGERALPY